MTRLFLPSCQPAHAFDLLVQSGPAIVSLRRPNAEELMPVLACLVEAGGVRTSSRAFQELRP